jgi:transcriptional regulator with XRE-family HTH domain
MGSEDHQNQLQRLRAERGLAQWALAVRCGVAPGMLSAVERHGYVPSGAVRQRIAAALNLSVQSIWPWLGGEPAPSGSSPAKRAG